MTVARQLLYNIYNVKRKIYHITIISKNYKYNKELELEASNFVNRAALSGNYRAEMTVGDIYSKNDDIKFKGEMNETIKNINKNVRYLTNKIKRLKLKI